MRRTKSRKGSTTSEDYNRPRVKITRLACPKGNQLKITVTLDPLTHSALHLVQQVKCEETISATLRRCILDAAVECSKTIRAENMRAKAA